MEIYRVSKQFPKLPIQHTKLLYCNICIKIITNLYVCHRNNEVISQESLTNAKILLLPGPLSKFTELEMNSIRTFLNSGGNVLVTLGEGGENKSNTNINFLLEEFGIMVNNGM